MQEDASHPKEGFHSMEPFFVQKQALKTLLRPWFLSQARDLPWRNLADIDNAPYAVWVSEIMLQQTQVSVVIPYFLRWMQQFPTITSLANAYPDTVIKAWEGLGYYSRARNLQRAAQIIVKEHGGKLPDTEKALSEFPGLGPYTVGAILAFAFHQKAAAVDGNVIRVMSRYLGIEDSFSTSKAMRSLQTRVLALLPDQEPWIVMEALIELGATVCRKQAECFRCPLKEQCHAYTWNQVELLPIPKKRPQIEQLEREVALVLSEKAILVRRCKTGEIMSDLHEFPSRLSTENQKEPWPWNEETVLEKTHVFSKVTHGYTRYRVTLHPRLFSSCQPLEIQNFFWQPLSLLNQLAFSAGHRKLAAVLLKKVQDENEEHKLH